MVLLVVPSCGYSYESWSFGGFGLRCRLLWFRVFGWPWGGGHG